MNRYLKFVPFILTGSVFAQNGPNEKGMPLADDSEGDRAKLEATSLPKETHEISAPTTPTGMKTPRFASDAGKASAADAGFHRYEVILQKMPFGPGPAPAPAAQPAIEAPAVQVDPGWALGYRLSMINKRTDGSVRVGVVRKADNVGFTLEVGDRHTEDGIELVSVDPENYAVVLRKGTDSRPLKMDFGKPMVSAPAKAPSASTLQVKRTTSSSSASFEKRRKDLQARLAARRDASNKVDKKPKYKGAELEKHLKNYQMDLIRQGGNSPLLPIPITPDMEKQLIKEGRLAPQDAKSVR